MPNPLTALLPLTLAALLASCGTARVPAPQATATAPALRALNDDICPSCGKPSHAVQAAWVWASEAGGLPELGQPTDLIEVKVPRPQDLTWARRAQVTVSGKWLHLSLDDTDAVSLPVACIQGWDEPRPAGLPALTVSLSGTASNVWLGGQVALSRPVDLLTASAAGDEVCAEEFGEGWHMLRANETADALPLGLFVSDLWASRARS
ncbi:hypothetical protein GO986_18890 [Deinococcus sp. HMF7620]|uniref:Uncharacterized protein n=1 Tax=Deinococcus arboris TaxID=2682977 RepID=A0A7C9I144_9DEIO|nr:hypothetical protein [Deinococcus arboris]MVN88810.1 hypothetical protein [Deinococcus arboris]